MTCGRATTTNDSARVVVKRERVVLDRGCRTEGMLMKCLDAVHGEDVSVERDRARSVN
jgi:hypothetical protein